MRQRLSTCALMLVAATPAAGLAQEAALPKAAPSNAALSNAALSNAACAEGPAPAREPDLAGQWDFYMDVDGVLSFGVLSVGRLDGRYGGTLTPVRTAPVVLRSLTVSDQKIQMVVGSREGDVTYDAVLSDAANRMCGVVTYHGARLYRMVAQRRPLRSSPQG